MAFTEGATHAFLIGAGMIWLGTVIALVFLNVKHEDLATDEVPEGVARPLSRLIHSART